MMQYKLIGISSIPPLTVSHPTCSVIVYLLPILSSAALNILTVSLGKTCQCLVCRQTPGLVLVSLQSLISSVSSYSHPQGLYNSLNCQQFSSLISPLPLVVILFQRILIESYDQKQAQQNQVHLCQLD